MPRNLWDRRLFMTTAGVAPLAAWTPWAPRFQSAQSGCSELLLRTVRNLKLTPHLGQAYLRPDASQSTPTRSEICNALVQRLGSAWVRSDSEQALTAVLARAIRQDFGLEDGICRVNDWILSKTECRLAALKFLEQGLGDAGAGRSLPAEQLPVAQWVQIRRWGPQVAEVGRPFNRQSDGGSAFWFLVERPSLQLRVFLDDIDLDTTVLTDRMSAHLVPDIARRVTARPRTWTVWLVDFERGTRQPVGQFTVRAASPTLDPADLDSFSEGSLREIEAWGPRSVVLGRPFNRQPDGSSAFWMKTRESAVDDVIWVLERTPMPTVLLPKMITARLSERSGREVLAKPGTYRVWLVSPSQRVKQSIGELHVESQ